MVRIRKEVDLNELEKFGFEEEESIFVWNNPFNNYMLMIDKETRTVTTRLDTDADETFYDLIQARISRKSGGIIWRYSKQLKKLLKWETKH